MVKSGLPVTRTEIGANGLVYNLKGLWWRQVEFGAVAPQPPLKLMDVRDYFVGRFMNEGMDPILDNYPMHIEIGPSVMGVAWQYRQHILLKVLCNYHLLSGAGTEFTVGIDDHDVALAHEITIVPEDLLWIPLVKRRIFGRQKIEVAKP